MELPDEARDPSEVSRISESVSGREAKTETNKQIRKECYLRMRKETDRDKGDMAANNNYYYLSVTKRTTKLRITNNKGTVLGSAMCLSVGGDGMEDRCSATLR